MFTDRLNGSCLESESAVEYLMTNRFPFISLFLLVCILMAVSVHSAHCSDNRTGIVRVYVFNEKGRPLRGTGVMSLGRMYYSDNMGLIRFILPEGEYVLPVRVAGKTVMRIKTVVVGSEVTEVILTVDGSGRISADIESPDASRIGSSENPMKKRESDSRIAGVVLDRKNGKPIRDARVFIKGVPGSATSGEDGTFSMAVPSGTYTVSVIHPDFSTETEKNIKAPGDGTAHVRIEMKESSVELESFNVIGYRIEGGVAAVINERKAAREVIDIIGAEQMSKSGDSDAASALKRATGLTVVGGRFVYVRGMGERYSCTLLNGSSLPSPEPEKRVVPLDIFPVSVIESMSIQKSFSPDKPAEFGGGVVSLKTKGMPEEFVLTGSISMGYHEGSNLTEGLRVEGAGLSDYTGFDDGTRALPGIVAAAEAEAPLDTSHYTEDELEKFGEAMRNVWSPREKAIPLNISMGTTIGDKYTAGDNAFGFLFGFVYGSNFTTKDKIYRSFSGGTVYNTTIDYNMLSTVHTIDLGSIADLAAEIGEHNEFKLTTLLVRTTTDTAKRYEGYYEAADEDVIVTETQWLEQQLFSSSLKGRHELPWKDVIVDWNYTLSTASRYEPDRRSTMYEWESSDMTWRISDRAEGNMIIYSELNDRNQDIGVNTTVPFKVKNGAAEFKTGLNSVFKTRKSGSMRFKFHHTGTLTHDDDILQMTPEEIFIPEYIGASDDGFSFREHTVGTDDYTADQFIRSVYATIDIPVHEDVQINGGLRREHSYQHVETFQLSSPTLVPIVADLETKDLLPAFNLIWDYRKNMKLRFGYGKTLSRPDFRELSEAPFETVVGGRQIIGNPDLDRCLIDNYDFRWEWYFSENESFSAGAFYKNLANPIEVVISGGSNSIITYRNAELARIFGVECEFRKTFEFETAGGESFDDFYMSGNISIISSDVKLGDNILATTESERPLQGQSPYVVNLTLGYDNPDSKTSAALLYNVFGPRIVAIGIYGLKDVYEQPFHQLDFVVSWYIKITEEGEFIPKATPWKFKFKIKNILDQNVVYMQGDWLKESYRKGRSYTFGLSAKF